MRKPPESAAASGRFLTAAERVIPAPVAACQFVSSLSQLGVELPGRQSLVTFLYIFKKITFICVRARVYINTRTSAIARI